MQTILKTIKISVIFAFLIITSSCSADLTEPVPSNRLQLGKDDNAQIDKYIENSWHGEKFIRTDYIDRTIMPAINEEQKKTGYIVFVRNWMDMVFPSSVPKAKEIRSELKIFASPGEYEPAVFCIRTLKDIKGLQISVTKLISKDGHSINAPEISLVRCAPRTWQGEVWIYEDGPVGVMNMPSYLEKLRVLDIAAGRTVQFWASVKVEDDAEPGEYQGRIKLTDEKGISSIVNLKVEVFGIDLQEPPQTLGFWDFQRHYFDEIGTIDEVYQIMADHGIRAVHTRAGLHDYDKKTDTYDFSKYISVDDDGNVSINLSGSNFEKRMKAAKKAGFRYMVVEYNVQFLASKLIKAKYDEKTLAEQSAAEIAKVLKRFEDWKSYETMKKEITDCSKHYPAIYSKVYGDLFVKITREVLEESKKAGYPEIVLPSWDEAFSNHHRNKDVYPYALRHLELYKQAGVKTELNHCSPFSGGEYGEYVRAAMGFLDIAMPAPRLSSNPHDTSGYHATLQQLIKAYEEKGIHTYNYSLSGGSGGVFPDLNITRLCAGYFFHSPTGKGLYGNFDYIYYRIEDDPYNPVDGKNWSHGRLWYFEPQAETGRLGGKSITLAAKREGYDDLRYIHTLKKLIEHAEATADMPKKQLVARRAAEKLKKITESIIITDEILDENHRLLNSRWDKVVAEPGKDSTVSGSLRLGIGWNHDDYNQNRWIIAQEIMKLQKILN